MLLPWEAVTAIASMLSSIAVVGAIVVAVRQVRVGADQVEHLRRATQLEGTMKIFALLASKEQQDARRFVRLDLRQRMADPSFRAEVALGTMAANYEQHQEMLVLRLMEMLGTYVKHGLLDAEIVFDYWIPAVVNTWQELESTGVIALQREAAGEAMWENFEDLNRRAREWLGARGGNVVKDPVTAISARNEVVADAPGT